MSHNFFKSDVTSNLIKLAHDGFLRSAAHFSCFSPVMKAVNWFFWCHLLVRLTNQLDFNLLKSLHKYFGRIVIYCVGLVRWYLISSRMIFIKPFWVIKDSIPVLWFVIMPFGLLWINPCCRQSWLNCFSVMQPDCLEV